MEISSGTLICVIAGGVLVMISNVFDPFACHAGVINVTAAGPTIVVMFVSTGLSDVIFVIVMGFASSSVVATIVFEAAHHCHHLLHELGIHVRRCCWCGGRKRCCGCVGLGWWCAGFL